MMNVLYIIVGVLLCLNQAHADEKDDKYYPRKDGILILDEHNFLAALTKYKFVLVLYYGKNKESVNVASEINKVQTALTNKESIIHIGTLDAERFPEVQKSFPIYETPTLRIFKNGRAYDYHGKREASKILTWLDLAMNVPIPINIAKELDDLKETTCVIVGCFPGKTPKEAFDSFYKASEYFVYNPHMTLPRFAVVTSASLGRSLGLVSGKVCVFKKFENNAKAVYNGDSTDFKKLLAFIEVETEPVVINHSDHDYSWKLHHSNIQYQHILFMLSTDRNFQETFQDFKDAARKFQRKENEVLFVHIDPNKESVLNMISYYHIDVEKDLPCIRMTRIDKFHSRFIPRSRDLNYKTFMQFTNDVVEGKLERNIRSEQQPSDWNAYDVKVLVGSTYLDFISDKSRTIFMMYYIDNQKESDDAQSVFNAVAKDMRGNRTVVFGKMNVGKNDGEIDVHIKYPSFKMFTKDGHLVYEDKVSAKHIKDFIELGGISGPKNMNHHDHIMGGMEYDFSWHDRAHPIDDPEEEEERRIRWAKEEKEILENAVTHEEAEEPHEHPIYGSPHGIDEEDAVETDPNLIDPQKHADFENHEYNLENENQHGDEL